MGTITAPPKTSLGRDMPCYDRPLVHVAVKIIVSSITVVWTSISMVARRLCVSASFSASYHIIWIW